jgi:hypothetical protein
LTLAACATSVAAHRSGTKTGRTSATTTTAPPSTTVPASVPATTAPAVPTSLPASGPTENIGPSAQDLAAFEAAYASFRGIPESDIAGALPGSTHEAFEPSAQLFWGTARYEPSQSAGQDAASFQDGGNVGVFTRTPTGAWKMVEVGGEPFPCPGELPADVLRVWGMTTSPYCH